MMKNAPKNVTLCAKNWLMEVMEDMEEMEAEMVDTEVDTETEQVETEEVEVMVVQEVTVVQEVMVVLAVMVAMQIIPMVVSQETSIIKMTSIFIIMFTIALPAAKVIQVPDQDMVVVTDMAVMEVQI